MQQPSNHGAEPARGADARNHHPLDLFDALFAQSPLFGDSGYLHEQLHIRYKSRLAKLSTLLPVAGELALALDETTFHTRYRTIGDPVVRHAVEQGLRHLAGGAFELPIADCEDVLRQTLGHLKDGKRGGPLESSCVNAPRLGPEPWHGWTWREEPRSDAVGRSFRGLIRDLFHEEPLCTPSATDLAKLAKGAQLLGILMPMCSQSVLSHTHVIVVVPHVGTWTQKGSCSDFRIGGTIFINRAMIDNPWWVAEHLLHESLHQKLYDFRHTHSLLGRDLSSESSSENAATVHSIWNVGGAARPSHWDTFRAVAALHVYVHQAVLCLQSERRLPELVKRFGAPDGSLPAMTKRREAFERGQYLGGRIKESCWQELGPAGRRLVDWLISILNAMDPAPPPSGSPYIHLLLNRYMTEATMIANKTLSPERATQLLKLITDEADTIQRVLVAVQEVAPDSDQLAAAVARRIDQGAGPSFLGFRSLVANILRKLSPDGYGLARSPSANSANLRAAEKLIQTMVESSSQQLSVFLDRPANEV